MLKNSSTFFYENIGRENLPQTIEIVTQRCKVGDINKVFIFAATKQSVIDLSTALKNSNCKVCAVSFPYKQTFMIKRGGEGPPEEVIPETSLPEIRNEFAEIGVELVQGVMPFEEIILPGVSDLKTQVLIRTLEMISRGLPLCVQAAIMACDGGYAEPGEKIIVMTADTAIVITAAPKKWIFHPKKGIDVHEILCKPYSSRIDLS
ncbi:MAG: hypothetical protein K6U80_19375 [Firmicutes bacterium]|nr:hypothetical protein [Bacillota bacterium]